MNIDTLRLRRHFYTSLDYTELKDLLKRRIGSNFKLGLIDEEQISLYYVRDWRVDNGLDQIPMCQLEIKNEKDKDGRTKIKFGVAGFVLIGLAFVPGILMFIFYFTNTLVPFYYAFGIYPILYLISFSNFLDQANKFRVELTKLEKEIRK